MVVQPIDRILREDKWENSVLLDPAIKKFMMKLLKRNYLNSAIKEFIKRRESGEPYGIALHKAAGMYGLESDKLFSDIIQDMISAGLITEETTFKTFSDFLAESLNIS